MKNSKKSLSDEMGNAEVPGKSNAASVSRRKFIKIGAATLTISVVGGGILRHFLPAEKHYRSIKASVEKPNKNPAFLCKPNRDGSLVCVSRLPNGQVLKHELNRVGAQLYLHCDGKTRRSEIIKKTAAELGKDAKNFTPDAERFFAELEKENLIVTTQKVNIFYRKVVRYEKA